MLWTVGSWTCLDRQGKVQTEVHYNRENEHFKGINKVKNASSFAEQTEPLAFQGLKMNNKLFVGRNQSVGLILHTLISSETIQYWRVF